MLESQTLAAEFFEKTSRGHYEAALVHVHPAAQFVPNCDSSTVLTRSQFAANVTKRDKPYALRAHADEYIPMDDERIIVRGRTLTERADRTVLSGEVVWAIVFRDGLLYRSFAVRTVEEGRRRLAEFGRSTPQVETETSTPRGDGNERPATKAGRSDSTRGEGVDLGSTPRP